MVASTGGAEPLLRYGDRQLRLDFGANFERFGTYYDESLRPRSAAGLLNYVKMGVSPDARGLYRDDRMQANEWLARASSMLARPALTHRAGVIHTFLPGGFS